MSPTHLVQRVYVSNYPHFFLYSLMVIQMYEQDSPLSPTEMKGMYCMLCYCIGCQISLALPRPDQTKNHPDLIYAAFERPFYYELLCQVSDLSYDFLYFEFNAFKIVFCVKKWLNVKVTVTQ